MKRSLRTLRLVARLAKHLVRVTARFRGWQSCIALISLLGFADGAMALSCTISAPQANFGSYDVFSPAALQTTTTISVTCARDTGDGGNTGVAYVIALSAGSGNSFVQRQMKSGTNSFAYNLYIDAARTQVWGDGSGASRTVSGAMTLNPGHPQSTNTSTVYANAAARQDVGVGTYSDTILMTVSY